MKNNKTWYYILIAMAYSISGFASVRLFWNMNPSLLDRITLVLMVTTYQIAIWFTLKFVFEIAAIIKTWNDKKNKLEEKITYKHKTSSRISFFLAYIFFSIFSIVASAALVYNSNATASNKAMIAKANIEGQIAAKNLAPAIVEAKTKEMNGLASTKDNAIQSYDNNKNNFSWKAASKINEIEDKKTATVSSINENIRKSSSELNDIVKSIAAPIQESSSSTPSSFGITGIITSSWWQTAFCIAFGIGIDFIGAFFTFAYAKEKYYFDCGNPDPKPKLEIPRPSEKPSDNNRIPELTGSSRNGWKLNKNNNILNFSKFRPKLAKSSENKGVNQNDIDIYLRFILDNQKNGLAPGRNKIVKGVGFSQEKCRTIHNILIDRGYLETGEKCTKIIKEVV